jgi:hypothetical protein
MDEYEYTIQLIQKLKTLMLEQDQNKITTLIGRHTKF